MFNPMLLKNSCAVRVLALRLQSFSGVLTKHAKCKDSVLFTPLHFSYNRTCEIKYLRSANVAVFYKALLKTKSLGTILLRHNHTDLFQINTNVQNNVILYKTTTRFAHMFMYTVGIVHCALWATVGYLGYLQSLRPYEASLSSPQDYLKKYGPSVLFIFSMAMAPITLGLAFFLASRNIKYLILNKGGKHFTIVTFHPIKKRSVLSVPVNEVKSTISRTEQKSYIPIKIKGRKFYYIIDKEGKFVNTELFDSTLLLNKNW